MSDIEMSPVPELASRLIALTEFDWSAGVDPESVAGVLGSELSRDDDQVAFPPELAAGELTEAGRLAELVWVVAREFPDEFFGPADDEEGEVDASTTSVADAAADLAAELASTLGEAGTGEENGWQLWTWRPAGAKLELALGEVDGIDLIEATVNGG